MADGDSPIFAVYYPDDVPNSPRAVYKSLKDAAKLASTPEAKAKGARFRKFDNPKDASDFLDNLANDSLSQFSFTTSSRPASSNGPVEPVIPHKAVTKIEMNALKRAIDKDEVETFKGLVLSNPRYLVNAGSDTAAIIMEGFRFNPLHVAARNGCDEIAAFIMDSVNDLSFLVFLYDTTIDDVTFRRDNIVASYLNTPDKGSCDTPLHIASKFGHVGVVRKLVTFPDLQKDLRNKEGLTACAAACSRYDGPDKSSRKKEIELLLAGFYVALYRSTMPGQGPTAKIVLCASCPGRFLSPDDNERALTSNAEPGLSPSAVVPPLSLTPEMYLAAKIGPIPTREAAEQLQQRWNTEGKEMKLSDVDKGYERLGRTLAREASLPFAESWCFLNKLIDLSTKEGLETLDQYLLGLRTGTSNHRFGGNGDAGVDDIIRKKLNFEEEDDSLPAPVFNRSSSSIDEFVDANESFVPDVADMLNDSLFGLTGALAQMSLNSPATSLAIQRLSTESFDDGDSLFCTPPSTPPPVFLLNEPTKVDNDLLLALSMIADDKLQSYPQILSFREKLSAIGSRVRADWPAQDSPRRSNSRGRLSQLALRSPI